MPSLHIAKGGQCCQWHAVMPSLTQMKLLLMNVLSPNGSDLYGGLMPGTRGRHFVGGLIRIGIDAHDHLRDNRDARFGRPGRAARPLSRADGIVPPCKGLPGPQAKAAAVSLSVDAQASGAPGSVLRVAPGACRRPQRTWSITSSRTCRCGIGCCRCRFRCACCRPRSPASASRR